MQLANYAQINDGRVDKIDKRTEKLEINIHTMMAMMGGMQHISIGMQQQMSMGVVLIDATGQRHSVPMCLAGSFNVRRCGSCR